MKHNYNELSKVLLAALENIPEEKSICVYDLIKICFPDYKYVSASYSEELKTLQNPYNYFNGEKWRNFEVMDFTFYFLQSARKSGFFLDNTKWKGGCYGTPDRLQFFVRRKPISKRILFQLKEFSTETAHTEKNRTQQVKVYYDGAVKCESVESADVMRKYTTDKETGHIIDTEKHLKNTFGGTYLVNKQIVERINSIYKENAAEINELPKKINNGSFDGFYQEFSFGTKKITCLNIKDSSEDEKTILRIFTEIKNIIDALTPENEWDLSWDFFNFLQ